MEKNNDVMLQLYVSGHINLHHGYFSHVETPKYMYIQKEVCLFKNHIMYFLPYIQLVALANIL